MKSQGSICCYGNNYFKIQCKTQKYVYQKEGDESNKWVHAFIHFSVYVRPI